MIKWRPFDKEKSFTEQASPDVPPEAGYDVTVTNVTPFTKKGSGCKVTCELTIDNGQYRPYCFDKGFWFPESGKQDYSVAELNALFFAADFSPVLPGGNVTPKQLALAIPTNQLRFHVDCVRSYQIVAYLDKNTYKSAKDDPDGGYLKKGIEKTDTLKYKKYLNVTEEESAQWGEAGGDIFVQLEPRRGSYVEMGLIYQPAKNSSERNVSKGSNAKMADAEFSEDDKLPF